MRAFVLSGGGNRGPLQAGALSALLRCGITPELVVGSSVGAMNGLVIAVNPSPAQAERLLDLWRSAAKVRPFTFSPLRAAANLFAGKEALADNTPLRRFIEAAMPPGVRTFGDLRLPLYVTICHLRTYTLYLYGDDPTAPLVDAVITSAAVPGFFPPTYQDSQAFVDGGVISNLPLKVALARGATEIWALDLALDVEPEAPINGAFGIVGWSVRRALYEGVLRELEWAVAQPGVVLHHIALKGYQSVALGEWQHTEAMLAEGEQVAQAYLAAPKPNVITYPRSFCAERLPPGPPGAKPFCL